MQATKVLTFWSVCVPPPRKCVAGEKEGQKVIFYSTCNFGVGNELWERRRYNFFSPSCSLPFVNIHELNGKVFFVPCFPPLLPLLSPLCEIIKK